MDLRQVRCFVVLADELHFGRAAHRLGLSQPPLSRTIRQLEEEIGAPLFLRDRRKVELAPAGAALLPRARRLLELSNEAVTEARLASEGRTGTLAVSFVGTAMIGLLPPVLREMRSRHPGVELRLHEMATDQQVEALLDGTTQAAFIRPGVVHPRLRSRTLLRESLWVALPSDHRLADRKTVSVSDLVRDPFVLFPRQTHRSLGNRVLELCAESGFAPVTVQEALEMQTALGLVAGGLGVAVVPESTRLLGWPGVAILPMPRPAPTIELSLAHVADDASPVLARFVEIAEAEARRLARFRHAH